MTIFLLWVFIFVVAMHSVGVSGRSRKAQKEIERLTREIRMVQGSFNGSLNKLGKKTDRLIEKHDELCDQYDKLVDVLVPIFTIAEVVSEVIRKEAKEKVAKPRARAKK